MMQEIPFRTGTSSDNNGYIQSTGESGQIAPLEGEREHERASASTSASTTLSCYQCRSRKVRCDRLKPSCSRCVRLGDECVFPNSRQKRMIRKKNLAGTLETRLGGRQPDALFDDSVSPGEEGRLDLDWNQHSTDCIDISQSSLYEPASDDVPFIPTTAMASQEVPSVSSDLLELGQFEQLPPYQLTERLVSLYFDELSQDAPMLHRERYTASLHRPAHMRPPMSLQYAVLALASTAREEFKHLAMLFYQRSRRYAEADEMKPIRSLGAFWRPMSPNNSCFPARLPQKPADPPLQPPRDFFEVEERRRTWWVVFCSDRFVGGITGWPALINDKDIETRLPASDQAFNMGTNETTPWLMEALQGAVSYSPFAGKALAAHTFYRTLEHTFRSFSNDGLEDTTDGPYWIRQRGIDADLSNLILYLPQSLRLPQGAWNRNAIIANVGIHTSVICIHRAALAKIRELGLPADLLAGSRLRLLPSAEQILKALESTSDARGAMNDHFLAFSAYLASLIFLEDYMETQSWQSEHNLNNLVDAMTVAGKKDPFSRSLAIQLATGMRQVGMDSRTLDRVKELPATSILIPLLAKRDKTSAHITFCSILPTKIHDYSSSPRQ
ncbi:hypothetical protein EDB81DRAFT_719784 [Dactylonectria macrodidyma]|uniref:Zn(2)-C6 fungal-type domain-containing protein n=1 Tax=Dactylonectria macrodidyma TaxID=307937 RepID=A0A9P9J380_9HYPO|nr:hypothetical protein EDB81DRAFT_719784 [Dactylonectria macrodidyma]